ncbi:MAG: ATP-dependent sacrificial sulfur transferase LarE [Saccharofermentanales bacterium]
MKLSDFFKENPKVALAFSGGVDSTYLLYVAKQYVEDVTAYYVKSDFQPQFELDDAKSISEQLGAKLKIIELDIFTNPDVINNGSERCYYCKSMIFSTIINQAQIDGYSVLLDGSNASDNFAERPGMRALTEFKVKSPLRECGLTKNDIRNLSAKAGLPTADKPSYSCLATRIPQGMQITKEKLQATEKAENFLFELGFNDFRIRHMGDYAGIQLAADEFTLFFEQKEYILSELRKYYPKILLDPEPRI